MTHFNMEYFILGVLGWFVQSLLKSKSIQDKARKANVRYNFFEYYQTDWISHLIALTFIGIAVYIVEEVFIILPSLQGLVKTFFVAVGFTNGAIVSYLITFMGKKFSVNAKVNDAVDHKTSIADDVTGNKKGPTPK